MSRVELGKSLNLSEDILPLIASNRPKPKNGVDRTYLVALNNITVHETDNTHDGADAQAHRKFVNNGGGKHGVSWHYTVDEGEVVKHMRLNERGIHANSGNAVSVGVEICVNSDGDLNEARDRATRLVAVLLYDTGLEPDRVVQHNHWSGKNCPRRLRAGFLGLTWEEFLKKIITYLEFANSESAGANQNEETELEPETAVDIHNLEIDEPNNENFEDDPHEGIPVEFLSVENPSS